MKNLFSTNEQEERAGGWGGENMIEVCFKY